MKEPLLKLLLMIYLGLGIILILGTVLMSIEKDLGHYVESSLLAYFSLGTVIWGMSWVIGFIIWMELDKKHCI